MIWHRIDRGYKVRLPGEHAKPSMWNNLQLMGFAALQQAVARKALRHGLLQGGETVRTAHP